MYKEVDPRAFELRPGPSDQDPYEEVIRSHYDKAEGEMEAAVWHESLHKVMGQIQQEYKDMAGALKTGYDFDALVEGLLAMHHLKRIILSDSRPPGISTGTAFEAPSLSLLRPHFPASDATFRVFSYVKSSPDHGFFTILRALGATGANVDMLVTERTMGLLKQGISLREFSGKTAFHQDYVQGFRHLRKISLCVDDNWEEASSANGWNVQDTALSECIRAAANLEHLELSLTAPVRRYLALSCLLPFTSLPNLHTLVLEGICKCHR